MIDSNSFREFEHRGWQGIPGAYHQAFGELTTQSIEPLLDAAGVKASTKVIDIASGPGYVAAAAARRGASVIGVDFAVAMVAAARERHPDVEFREGDAEELPLSDNVFDAAVMNFGILHLARPDQSLAEACRVLSPGGRFAFTVWAKPEESIGFQIVLGAIAKHGDQNVPLPQGPPFFCFSDPDECRRSLIAAGFASPTVVKVPQLWRLPTIDSLFEFMLRSTVRTAGLLRAQKPAALEKIRDAMRAESKRYQKGNAVELPMPAVLASAPKP
ncbi:MAG: methyltransferase domain-containing protein [Candidatus Binatia bacterium]